MLIARRHWLKISTAAACSPFSVFAQDLPDELRQAIAQYTGARPWTEAKVHLDIATLVDNGNTVPISVRVDSAMTGADRVTGIAVFSERNPLRDVVRFNLSAETPIAQVDTRIRLATTQKIVAIARMQDGSFLGKTANAIVTIAACIETD
jgi:sulfur-oxidizing protein SoxY